MPNWYVHIQAAAEMLEALKAGVPAGSPLTQAEAVALHDLGHTNRNYLAAGALGPDLFFLLPDYKGDLGTGLLALVNFALGAWKTADDTFVGQWERWMSPVLDEKSALEDQITGGMLGEIGQVHTFLGAAVSDLLLSLGAQSVDLFGKLTSATQAGFEDTTFFWSDMFHYRKTYAFARALYKNALLADVTKPPTEPSRIPKQQAFALGWISHCATDVAGHPFTNAKVGGPYRLHWQRHHVVENHMDAFVYNLKHSDPMLGYESFDTAALHFRLAFKKGVPPMPDDEPSSNRDWFPGSWMYPQYPQGESPGEQQTRKHVFDLDSEPLPAHICDLLITTMKEVYGGPMDDGGPQVLKWDNGMDGRPTVEQLQAMFELAYRYLKISTSAGLSMRKPSADAAPITDHSFPMPPGVMPDDSAGANPNEMHELTLLDILLAILAFSIWMVELTIWLATTTAAVFTDLATWPARELIHETLVIPAWSLYMLCRNPLIMAGYLVPKPEEISPGLVTLGLGTTGPLIQLHADLNDPSGFAPPLPGLEPSGLGPDMGASTQGFGADPAYPRGVLTDLDPPFFAGALIDSPIVPSEFVAPWRYPEANLGARRNGWEAPRTHVGPYVQGQDPSILMNKFPGTDAARQLFEAATSPEETEAVSAGVLSMGTTNSHLGNPIEYGKYLIGKLTGAWTGPLGVDGGYMANDDGAPLPDFNLDADRGYGYQCWDYVRHVRSAPPSLDPMIDAPEPDQWRAAPASFPADVTKLFVPPGGVAQLIRDMYGYQEPCTVPQGYNSDDNAHHRSHYDPLKHLYHQYIQPADRTEGHPKVVGCDIDLQVSSQEMLDAMLSPSGRRVP